VDIIETLKEILMALYILAGLVGFIIGVPIGQRLERRNILKKLRLSGKVDASTLALLEEY